MSEKDTFLPTTVDRVQVLVDVKVGGQYEPTQVQELVKMAVQSTLDSDDVTVNIVGWDR